MVLKGKDFVPLKVILNMTNIPTGLHAKANHGKLAEKYVPPSMTHSPRLSSEDIAKRCTLQCM
ncbi:hypothetical protein KDA_19870 [Dictyobacter alpinus]|uniref:Uncharacterized protein n=1 Tax=Dictyobacter alpinus TaxID=2014873 RepID=A0A402B580_9CHLR|nr:hypothetical protein KDA_19870 [Dictyobacter alpinus]